MLNNNLKNQKGFTLAELLITIFVFTVGILGIYLVVQNSYATINYAKNRLIAIYLAQEGIEIVRNIRDTNWLEEEESWDEGLFEGTSRVQYDKDFLLPDGGETHLRIDNNGFYTYDDGTNSETPFRRKVDITKIDDDTILVTVEVKWSDKFSPVILQEKLYNWHP